MALIGVAWLVNQSVGYLVLGYPQTWDSFAWGATIGVAGALAVLVVTECARRFGTTLKIVVGSQFTNSDRLFFILLYRGEGIALHIGEQIIRASSPRGAISLRVSDHVRALAFGASQNSAESDIIVLAVPLEHATFVPQFGLTNLGPDVGTSATNNIVNSIHRRRL